MIRATPHLYFPATPRGALLSVMKSRCAHFIAFDNRRDALRAVHVLNAKAAVLLKGAPIECTVSDALTVHESNLEALKVSVPLFGVLVCAFEEPNVLTLERTYLGPGHGSIWSSNHQRAILERAISSTRDM